MFKMTANTLITTREVCAAQGSANRLQWSTWLLTLKYFLSAARKHLLQTCRSSCHILQSEEDSYYSGVSNPDKTKRQSNNRKINQLSVTHSAIYSHFTFQHLDLWEEWELCVLSSAQLSVLLTIRSASDAIYPIKPYGDWTTSNSFSNLFSNLRKWFMSLKHLAGVYC